VSRLTRAREQRWRGHRPQPHTGAVDCPPRLLHAPHMRPRRRVPLPRAATVTEKHPYFTSSRPAHSPRLSSAPPRALPRRPAPPAVESLRLRLRDHHPDPEHLGVHANFGLDPSYGPSPVSPLHRPRRHGERYSGEPLSSPDPSNRPPLHRGDPRLVSLPPRAASIRNRRPPPPACHGTFSPASGAGCQPE
jgi:hypothetical protein